MTTTLIYKGYSAIIAWDEEAQLFHGEVCGIKDVITFQGATIDELYQAMKDSIDDYLEFCAERGEPQDTPPAPPAT